MRLYLVRHAIAHDPDPSVWPDDRLRPLTDRGIKRFRRAARGLGRLGVGVDFLLTSPYTRARETAQILHEEAGWVSPTLFEPLGTSGPVTRITEALEPFRAADSIALVGHEPDMHALTSYLLTGNDGGLASEWKRGAVACLELPGGFVPEAARLLWFLPPRALREMALRK